MSDPPDTGLAEAVGWAEEEISVAQYQDECDREYANRLRALLNGLERLKAELAEARESVAGGSRPTLLAGSAHSVAPESECPCFECEAKTQRERAEQAEAALAAANERADLAEKDRLCWDGCRLLKTAPPEAKPLCPYCGESRCRYGVEPGNDCHARGDSCRCVPEPKPLPLGRCPKREGIQAHVIPAGGKRCSLCFPEDYESAHR